MNRVSASSMSSMALWFSMSVCVSGLLFAQQGLAAPTGKSHQKVRPAAASPAVVTALRYAQALAGGDRETIAKLDFSCQYPVAAAAASGSKGGRSKNDISYETCLAAISAAHASALTRDDVGMDIVWPSNGPLVVYRDHLDHYPASVFVMDALGLSPPGSGLHLDPAGSKSIPAVSFRLRRDGRILAAPATLVKLVVTYQDPLTSPLTYAQGSYQFASTTKRPQRVLKSATVQWVVLAGLKRHGFPMDHAVVNLPVRKLSEGEQFQEAIPFLTEQSQVLINSLVWWGPADAPGLLIAATARAASFPDLKDRIALLNRVLLIDPNQPDALTVLTRNLYSVILKQGAAAHNVPVKDPALALAISELYWNTYAQTTRTELSLGMVMGGFAEPTTADYLYRMIPAMETLAKVRPEQLDNRTHLGTAYRWNNDQRAAISTHEALLKDIPKERTAARSQALIELAWSRINQVAWNRRMEDPEIQKAYDDAREAYKTADLPVDKFVAAYTMAYSMLYMPHRDNKAMLEHLTEAKLAYDQIPNVTPSAWRYVLAAEQLRAVLDADPAFQPLLAATS